MNIDMTEDGAQQHFPFWYGDQIGRGFRLLSILNLPHSPKGDQFIECVGLWAADTWWAMRQVGLDGHVDEDTMQEAFRLLRTTATRWPVPQQFLIQLMNSIHRRQ